MSKLLKTLQAWIKEVPANKADKHSRPFITISRQAGSGAYSFACELAERLSTSNDSPWLVVDRQFCDLLLQDETVNLSAKAMFEEIGPLATEDWEHGVQPETLSHQFCRKTTTFIRRLAQHGHVILLGRGSAAATQDFAEGLHIRLKASMDYRVKHMVASHDMLEDEARKHIEEQDRSRSTYVNKFFSRDIDGSELYDICYQVDELSVDRMCSFVENEIT